MTELKKINSTGMTDTITKFLTISVASELELVKKRAKDGWYDVLPDAEQISLAVWNKTSGKDSPYRFAVRKYGPIAKNFITSQVDNQYLEMAGGIIEDIKA